MSASRHIDKICMVVAVFTLLAAVLLMNGEALGLRRASAEPAYAGRLFDTERVHTIDIVMDDWEDFLAGCTDEEYVSCAVVIDGEAYKNVGFRVKGNTSMTAVRQMGSDRYSFKIEFDHYEQGKSFHGLDKLCLNNIVQDNTYLKDYLCYTMMGDMGVAAPLCSFAFLTVNGADWGLYLAVEGVEEAFLQRNYGRDCGELYKPDSEARRLQENPGGTVSPRGERPGGMESGDLSLRYSDDEIESYPNIFDNAKTDPTQADRQRLVAALKALSEGRAEEAVDTEAVIRYFVVHSFVCNEDSYTGTMAHNYYLYEEEGRMAMIPWDYNLAFGGFRRTFDGFRGAAAARVVNTPIDTPVTGAALSERPMAAWIFADEAYTEQYHQVYGAFLERWFGEGRFEDVVNGAAELIAPYVERDPTKFCTAEEFAAGVEALRTFCRLRAESAAGQLAGTVPSTAEGQAAAPESLVDTGELDLRDMGSMEGLRGGFAEGGGGPEERQGPPRADGRTPPDEGTGGVSSLG